MFAQYLTKPVGDGVDVFGDGPGREHIVHDLPALGWRHRRHYDMRATFITFAIDDGADAEVLESRVTHTRKSRSAFDGYNRGLQWERTCAEVLKLRITRGGRSPAAEQPIAAGSGVDSLHFAADLASILNQGKIVAAPGLPHHGQPRAQGSASSPCANHAANAVAPAVALPTSSPRGSFASVIKLKLDKL